MAGPSAAKSSFQLSVFGERLTAATSVPGVAACGTVSSTGTCRQIIKYPSEVRHSYKH